MPLELSSPLRWKFTAEADVAAYGDRWWVWDEPALIRLGGRELIHIEETIGMPILVLLENLRERTTLGMFTALWVSMRMAGHTVPWKEFDPTVFATQWEAVPDETPLDSGGDQPTPESVSSPEPATESATS